ncbi:unnamed protein product [Clonostachys rosea]|uniref:Zn(2)-C6 fungal-type domain-containing protein n=1 Tax=Bionectria ochroleuca TaxID=29856 RepID=A0ABY6TXU6_BIOOC|nr:unnamed protein product [Clonostachys rosea]
MTGILRSVACQNCKQKRTKASQQHTPPSQEAPLTLIYVQCDQNWPSCSQCIRKGVRCPGPSSLMKIINNGSHVIPPTASSSQTAVLPAKTSGDAVLVQRKPLMRYANGNAMSGRLRLQVPRFTFSTNADTVAAQAAALVQSGELTAFAVEQLLEYCPQRLSQSSCLLDCAALLCQVWMECFKRHEALSKVLESKAYGKAIRSLRRAVASDQLYTVETAAAMMLFYRFIRFTGLYSSYQMMPHEFGIRRVVRQIGLPHPNDDLHWEIRNEYFSMMLELMIYHPELRYPEQDFYLQPQETFGDIPLWSGYPFGDDSQQEETDISRTESGDASNEKESEQISELDAGTGDDEETLLDDLNEAFYPALMCYYRSWFPKIVEIRQNPSEMETERRVLCKKLAMTMQKMEAVNFWQRLVKLGCITESLDPDFFLGYRYEFTSLHIAAIAIPIIMIEALIFRTHYDLGSLGYAPDGDVYRTYLEACARGWLCLPYLHTVDALSSAELLRPLLHTLEPASTEQLAHMLRLDIGWEVCGLKNPKDIEGSKAWIHEVAKKLTGRMPRPKNADSSDGS